MTEIPQYPRKHMYTRQTQLFKLCVSGISVYGLHDLIQHGQRIQRLSDWSCHW